ncbi:hypothetical protein LTR37_007569 [Vermiconidia calcicola]|uniref:Uncharacterized protein n=1 Tax=Vermiconidia calcicola TaxID=1690605 RepID=A0ACC3NDP9_9PEZI|nr:hypothetical protein LTR37_007569 [Vermiconidia calcicola]
MATPQSYVVITSPDFTRCCPCLLAGVRCEGGRWGDAWGRRIDGGPGLGPLRGHRFGLYVNQVILRFVRREIEGTKLRKDTAKTIAKMSVCIDCYGSVDELYEQILATPLPEIGTVDGTHESPQTDGGGGGVQEQVAIKLNGHGHRDINGNGVENGEDVVAATDEQGSAVAGEVAAVIATPPPNR